MAAVDLGALAVARHIPLEGAPTEVTAAAQRPSVYALTPENGVGARDPDRQPPVGPQSSRWRRRRITMALAVDERTLYVSGTRARVRWSRWRSIASRRPGSCLFQTSLWGWRISPDGKTAAVSSAQGGPPGGSGSPASERAARARRLWPGAVPHRQQDPGGGESRGAAAFGVQRRGPASDHASADLRAARSVLLQPRWRPVVRNRGGDGRGGGGVPVFHAPGRRYGSGRPRSGSHGCVRRLAVRGQSRCPAT